MYPDYNNPDVFSTGPYAFVTAGFIFLYFVFVIGIVLIHVFYNKTMIDVMSYVRPSNRQTSASNILLNYIPLFGIVYSFIVYPKICDSIKKEHEDLGISDRSDYGKGLALALCILIVAMVIPFLNFLAFLPAIIVWILFWVKMDGYKNELKDRNEDGFFVISPEPSPTPSYTPYTAPVQEEEVNTDTPAEQESTPTTQDFSADNESPTDYSNSDEEFDKRENDNL